MNTVTPLFLYVAQPGVYMSQSEGKQKSRDAKFCLLCIHVRCTGAVAHLLANSITTRP